MRARSVRVSVFWPINSANIRLLSHAGYINSLPYTLRIETMIFIVVAFLSLRTFEALTVFKVYSKASTPVKIIMSNFIAF